MITRLSKVIDPGDFIPKYWPAIMFVSGLEKKFPIWADRQRTRQREADIKSRPSLDALISDIQDEARRIKTNSTNVSETQALYGNKGNNGPDNKKREYNNHSVGKKCPGCSQPNPKHTKENCLNANKEKRVEWEKKTGRKWVPYKKYQQSQKQKKQKEDDSDSDSSERVGVTRKFSMVAKFPVQDSCYGKVLNASTIPIQSLIT